MPIEFIQQSQPAGSSSDTLFRLLMKYDGTGRRISKTVMHKVAGAADWDTAQVTHYTGIGTEIRENYHNESLEKAKVVINMPEGLGRYGVEDAKGPDMGFGAGYIPNVKFEWYLKNHLGSTMLVYGSVASTDPNTADIGETKATYDYRAFGEQVSLAEPADKVTENFTGKEKDDETELDYFGARYLDPMLGMWISVDPNRQFSSPYLYAGNGMNPVNGVDGDENVLIMDENTYQNYMSWLNSSTPEINAIRWERFNTLNNSPRVYQTVYSEEVDYDFTIGGDRTRGEYFPKTNIGYVNGTMENFFHEILGRAYQDEMMMQKKERDLGKGYASKEEFITLEIDAREIEKGRLLNESEIQWVEKVYGDIYDKAE